MIVFTKNLSRPCSRLCSDAAKPADWRSRARSLGLLVSLLGLSLVFCGSALAAAPEEPETSKAEPVTNTTAVLHGTVNPHAKAAVSWHFAYNEGSSCSGGKVTTVEGPAEVEAVSVDMPVIALRPGQEYTYCLVATGEAEEETVGNPVSFVTAVAAPTVDEQAVANVTATEVTVSAQVGAGGALVSYAVEYGVAEPYSTTAPQNLPAGEGASGVIVRLTGLSANTRYHYRFVAHSALGTTSGSLDSFNTTLTRSSEASTLPDGRTYELVSSAPGNQEVYVPTGKVENTIGFKSDVFTERPFRASADGGAIAYVSEPGSSGEGTGNLGQEFGDEWLARRAQAGGWQGRDIQPPLTKSGTEYQTFSSDLSAGFLTTTRKDRLTEDALPGCRGLYRRDSATGGFNVLFTSTQNPGFCGEEREPTFAGTSADESRLFFQTTAALTPGSVLAPGEGAVNLYESNAGIVRAVNVLPSGEPDPNATFGGPANAERERNFDFSNAISTDGQHAFWTDVNTQIIYLREGGARTVQVAAGNAPAQFWTATRDGRYAFYTEDEVLYRFNVAKFDASASPESAALAEAREALVSEGVSHEAAQVKGIIGTSEDGTRIYFVAGAVLSDDENTGGETPTVQTCAEPGFPTEGNQAENVGDLEGKGCNLYDLHVGEAPRFIGTLAPKDNVLPVAGNTLRVLGDWRPDLGSRTAEVTPDGTHLLFMSRQRFTGYNNGGKGDAENPSNGQEREVEIFVYDARGSGSISCASCNQSAAPPVVFEEAHGGGTLVPPSTANAFMRRWMSDSGMRVFFDTSQALVPSDTNNVQDVYEWEQDGTGSCSRVGGCIYLLSGGSSADNSFLLDASASGGDVFFATRAELVAGAGDQKMEVYDAHECSNAAPCAPETALACTGTGCQGIPPAPPIFATPATATFAGGANFFPAVPQKGHTAAPTRAQRLAAALRLCRKRKNRHNHAICEVQARKRFGQLHKPTHHRAKHGVTREREANDGTR